MHSLAVTGYLALIVISMLTLVNFGVALVGAAVLWPRRKEFPLAGDVGQMLLSVFLMGVCWLIGQAYLPRPRPPGYRFWMSIGYLILTASTVKLVYNLVRKRKEIKPE